MSRQHLIFDADDTLWRSGHKFGAASAEFCELLSRPGLSVERVQEVLDQVAKLTYDTHGTTTRNYLRGAEITYRLLAEEVTPDGIARVEALSAHLSWAEPELIDGVFQTLRQLRDRHDLLLLTRGDDEEQQAKIDASGLISHFRATIVVPDKDARVYTDVVYRYGLDPELTWMIGNSTRYDIAPALEAGLRAVHIPEENPWGPEQGRFPEPEDGMLLRLSTFPDLLHHF
ncbi:MAG: HAD family hydrolase [Actinobacteria bacterium]|nr:HAD family hydrolase [Actinomycetota bacterium]